MQIFYEMEWLGFFFFVKCNIELFFVDPEPRGKMNVQKIPADQDPKHTSLVVSQPWLVVFTFIYSTVLLFVCFFLMDFY